MSDDLRRRCRVLVTGSTGAVGQPVCAALLARGHTVRGLARRPTPGVPDAVQGDLADRDAVRRAVEGTDTIVHLGAHPDDADFLDVLLRPNVLGLVHICDAAREFGVERLVLASTVQVTSGLERRGKQTVRIEDGVAPTNHYALTKVWAEATGEMYARCYRMSVLAVRIGWLPRDPAGARAMGGHPAGPAIYLSHNDAGRFFVCSVESPRPARSEYAAVFATSRPPATPSTDLEPAQRLLGYEPQDTYPEGLAFALDG